MNGADWIILGVILLSSGIGIIRGLMREAIALVTWLLGLWLAWTFSDVVEPYLGGLLSAPSVKLWTARLIVFGIVLLFGTLVGIFLSYIVRHSPFGTADRVLGLFFGFLRGIVVIGVFVIVGRLLELDGETWWKDSRLLPYAGYVADWLKALVGNSDVASIALPASTLT